MAKKEPTENGLPTNVDAERFILGSILLNEALFLDAQSALEQDDFSLEKHRIIFKRMGALSDRGEHIDRITVHNELMMYAEAQSVGGLSYLVELDDGLPEIPNIDSYIRIVKEKSRLRKIIFASQNMMNRALAAEDTSQEIITGAEETLMGLVGDTAEAPAYTPEQIITGYEGGLNQFLDPSLRPKGITTGFYRFDGLTTGLKGGDLFIIAGRPSSGKSTLARNIVEHVVLKLNKLAVVFSLEVSKEKVLEQMMCSQARVDSHKFKSGKLIESERHKLNHSFHDLMSAPLYIDDTAAITTATIRSKLMKIIKLAKQPLGLVMIDYLQLMGSSRNYENRNQEVTAQSRQFKLMAKSLKVPIILLSQLSRAPDQRKGDHRPQLSDLRESGAIEQDADIVGFVYREEMFDDTRDDLKGLADLIVKKNRDGPVATIPLIFLNSQVRFENRAEDVDEEHAA